MLVSGFSLAAGAKNSITVNPTERHSTTSLSASGDNDDSTDSTVVTPPTTTTAMSSKPDLYIPLSLDEMVKQTSAAMEDAMAQGKNRQIVRILLPRSSDNDQLLQYYESNVVSSDRTANNLDVKLCPTDETWQGGIMQLYRAASLACQAILRRYSRNASGGVVPRLQEDRSLDESGVDGIGLWITQGASPKDDVSCFVQPSQETVSAIESISNQAGSRLVALLNPQWRIVDDALDKASRSEGAFGKFASFLGGKGGSLRRLEELGFETVFVLEGYVCRGGNVRIVHRFDSEWAVFAENDAGTDYIRVGGMPERPSYQDVDKMLEEKGISLKYARDIGLAPKL
ncbi:DUF1995 domain containing protein [Nitzschia inconspicua]|uniref:DUF1995 domain containing protein n=1 Tax=Nitzschia inconspicua TaxID=303405 RepID=A0A9K3PAM4_9STRA|nr:DUF1995 domain containing protein [Nitzschia inconspicua]KAG7342705.1 DUF1995 domain containing protein [Nitzschia inconspicua]